MTSLFVSSAAVYAQQGQRTHIVQPGETASTIAARYGVTTASLIQTNGIINPNVIYVGQVLTIPPTGGPVVIQPAPSTARTHIVAAGEQLRFIAARYGTTWQTLAAVNKISNPNLIYTGQVLVIPPVGGPVVVQPPTPPTTPIVGGRYIVQPGDTMFKIGARFGVDVWTIARANGILNLNRIYAGQSLIIPGR